MCLLVMIGVRADGTQGTDRARRRVSANRPSRGLICCAAARGAGMRAPVLAVGDGALGFWKALREVFPDTREQRCWFHKIANVLAALPKSAHTGAKAALAEIYNAEDSDHALRPRPRRSPPTTAPSGPRRSPRSPTTSTCCWPSTTTPPSTGSTCAPPTRSSPPSPPSGSASASPRAPAPAPPVSRWRSSSSNRPPPMGGGNPPHLFPPRQPQRMQRKGKSQKTPRRNLKGRAKAPTHPAPEVEYSSEKPPKAPEGVATRPASLVNLRASRHGCDSDRFAPARGPSHVDRHLWRHDRRLTQHRPIRTRVSVAELLSA